MSMVGRRADLEKLARRPFNGAMLRGFAGTLTVALLLGAAAPSDAADAVSVGKAVPDAWSFLPLDVGVRDGLFVRDGLEVTIVNFDGDAKLQQGLAAASVAFGLGSGPSMAFAAKGSPVIAVAAFAGAPYNMAILVGPGSPIKSVTDLRGKTVSVSSEGSLTQWLVERVAIAQGWGKSGIRTAALGGFQPSLAALRAHDVDAMSSSVEGALVIEERHLGHLLAPMAPFAPTFITHVVFARDRIVHDDPGLVRRFLAGFFAAIELMRADKATTVAAAEAALHMSPSVASAAYDKEIAMFETDGSFDPAAVTVLKRSFLDMGILTSEPPDRVLYTTEFVPVRP